MMMLSRIAGSVSRSARFGLQSNRYSGFRHVAESCLEDKACVNGGIGAVNCRQLLPNNYSLLASPIIRRHMFCTQYSKRSDSNAGHKNSEVDDLVAFGSLALVMLVCHSPEQEQIQISFEEFSNLLQEHGLVDHIEVVKGSIARVYLKMGQQNDNVCRRYKKSIRGDMRQYKHYFKVESGIQELEEKLKEVQSSLGIEPHDYVLLVYSWSPFGGRRY